jgi:hypothetical protein
LETAAKLERKYKKQIGDLREGLADRARWQETAQRCKAAKEKAERQAEKAAKRVAVLEAQAAVDAELVAKLQRKLDDMWERQALERENVRLMSRQEGEREIQARVQAMGERIIRYEAELKHLN